LTQWAAVREIKSLMDRGLLARTRRSMSHGPGANAKVLLDEQAPVTNFAVEQVIQRIVAEADAVTKRTRAMME
jgi:hypothetical protein